MKLKSLTLIFILVLTVSCSGEKILEQADKLYKNKNYIEALKYYEKYYSKNKSSTHTDYVLYMIGKIYNQEIGDCDKSSKFFEILIKEFPESKYREEAYFRHFICPNYIYPVDIKKLVYGDSQTYGKNAKEIIEILSKDYRKIKIKSKIFAGQKLVNSGIKEYLIYEDKIIETSKNQKKVILKYPIDKNTFWEEKVAGLKYEFEVKKIDKIKVKAGVFRNCVKVIEKMKNAEGGIVNYYAPETGRILTTSIYREKETRIMELVKYE